MAQTTGKKIFLDSLVAHGVDYIFGNPGTTEMPIMDSLIDHPSLRYILALHEGVAVSAAQYYAQASGKIGVVNLHVGPGLGNGLGMLYNAFEANTPLLITAGQQDTRLRLREPLLGHDLVAMAKPLVKWAVQAERAEELPLLMHRALKIACDPPAGPVFVSLPLDVMEQTTDAQPLPPSRLYRNSTADPKGITTAVDLMLGAKNPVIVCGDGIAHSGAQGELIALAETLGATVWFEQLTHHVNFPTNHPNGRDRMPGEHAAVRKALAEPDVVLLVGGHFFEEVWYDEESPFPETAAIIQVEAAPDRLAMNFSLDAGLLGDPKTILQALKAELSQRADEPFRNAVAGRQSRFAEEKAAEQAKQKGRAEKGWDHVPIAPARLMAELRAGLPDNAVIVNESITATMDLKRTLSFSQKGEYYGTRGGGIGQGFPGALGVQLAHPDQPVIALSGDGSAMYSIQCLWSAAHHNLPVVFIVLHNRAYRILKLNMNIYRQRFGIPGERPYPHMDFADPSLEFVSIAKGLGVEGKQVTQPEEIQSALAEALSSAKQGKPYLLEVFTDGRV